MLGDSFADMAQGRAPVSPMAAAAPSAPVAHAPTPATTAVAVPQTAETSAPVPAPNRRAAQVPVGMSGAVRVRPDATLPAESPNAAARVEASERPEADVMDVAPQTSVRPRARPLAVIKPKAQPPGRDRTKQASQPPAAAPRAARAGVADGQADANARQKGRTAGSGAASGTAAAANYPGLVMAKIMRTRRESVSARGAAQVRFAIADNGGLASLVIARSSGSPRLDQAALRQVRQAAPFPTPPAGARRSFSIEIKGR